MNESEEKVAREPKYRTVRSILQSVTHCNSDTAKEVSTLNIFSETLVAKNLCFLLRCNRIVLSNKGTYRCFFRRVTWVVMEYCLLHIEPNPIRIELELQQKWW
jgi:hypothetical protein